MHYPSTLLFTQLHIYFNSTASSPVEVSLAFFPKLCVILFFDFKKPEGEAIAGAVSPHGAGISSQPSHKAGSPSFQRHWDPETIGVLSSRVGGEPENKGSYVQLARTVVKRQWHLFWAWRHLPIRMTDLTNITSSFLVLHLGDHEKRGKRNPK